MTTHETQPEYFLGCNGCRTETDNYDTEDDLNHAAEFDGWETPNTLPDDFAFCDKCVPIDPTPEQEDLCNHEFSLIPDAQIRTYICEKCEVVYGMRNKIVRRDNDRHDGKLN